MRATDGACKGCIWREPWQKASMTAASGRSGLWFHWFSNESSPEKKEKEERRDAAVAEITFQGFGCDFELFYVVKFKEIW